MTTVHPKHDMGETVFTTVMYWRIGYGVLRLCIGYWLLHIVGQPLADVFARVVRHEIIGHDQIFGMVSHALEHHGYSVTYFLAAHFFFWGVIDIILSYAMIRHQLWAFVTSIYLILLFVAYELYRYTHTHSELLFVFVLTDIFFMYLIIREYRKLQQLLKQK